MSENKGNNLHKGMVGLVSFKGRKFPVDGWYVNHDSNRVMIQCDRKEFSRCYELEPDKLSKIEKTEWLFRVDSEDKIFHGIGKVHTIAVRKVSRPRPRIEYFRNNLVVLFEIVSPNYGPFSLVECITMARNGNPLFFDLLSLREIEERVKAGDLRFLNNHI